MVPDGTTILIRINNSSIDRKFALVILNSSLINYIMCRYILSYGVRIFRNYLLYMLPLHLPLDQSPYIILADYMLFLNAIAIENKDSDIEKYIEFIDRQIIDSLVYELYLKEKFFEDRIYPEPKEYLLKVISKSLKILVDKNIVHYYNLAWGCTSSRSLFSEIIDPRGFLYKCWGLVGLDDQIVGSIFSGKNQLYVKYIGYNPLRYDKCQNCSILPFCIGVTTKIMSFWEIRSSLFVELFLDQKH